MTIRASGPVALEVQHLAPQLLERIARHLGPWPGRAAQGGARDRLRGLAEEQAPSSRPSANPAGRTRGALRNRCAPSAKCREGPLRDVPPPPRADAWPGRDRAAARRSP
ncbi:MAG: hypothetical protein RML45_09690 [Acetobacteraceae bacterium]|nr:hypothetical protein [Acetobacteraceae bacterium]